MYSYPILTCAAPSLSSQTKRDTICRRRRIMCKDASAQSLTTQTFVPFTKFCAEDVDCRRREQERQERLQRALEVEEAEWINQAAQEGSEEEQELVSIPDELYCPLCDKSFKSQNALVNHERCCSHVCEPGAGLLLACRTGMVCADQKCQAQHTDLSCFAAQSHRSCCYHKIWAACQA